MSDYSIFTARFGGNAKLYGVWNTMKQRCSNPNSPVYHRYGGRGIRVCARWMSFENF